MGAATFIGGSAEVGIAAVAILAFGTGFGIAGFGIAGFGMALYCSYLGSVLILGGKVNGK